MTSRNGEMPGRLLTVAEVVKVLRTSEWFPRRLIADRRIDFVRVSRHVRVSGSAPAKFIQSGVVKSMTFRDFLLGRA